MALSGKVGAVYIQTSTSPVVFTNVTTTADSQLLKYTVQDATKRYWDKYSPVTVKVNGNTVTSGFKIQYCGGVIVFSSPLTVTDVVTVSGSYHTVEQHGGFFKWSVDMELDTTDVTTFKSSGWKENMPSVKGYSASGEAYWGDSKFISNLGKEVVLAFYTDATASKRRYEGFGIVSSEGIEASADDVINDSIEIQGIGEIYYREG